MARFLDGGADLRPIRDLPRGVRSGSGGLPPGVVCAGHPRLQRGEEHPGAEGGAEAAGTGGHGQHAGAEPEGEAGVHAPGRPEQEPAGEELMPRRCERLLFAPLLVKTGNEGDGPEETTPLQPSSTWIIPCLLHVFSVAHIWSCKDH